MADRKVEDCIYKRGGRYSVRVRVHGRQVREAARTLADARVLRDTLRHASNTNTYIERADRDLTMDEWITQVLDRKLWAASTTAKNASIIGRHIRPHFGTMRVSAVRKGDVEAWVKMLVDAERTPHTIHSYFGALSALFRAATLQGIRPTNPCHGVKRPTVVKAVNQVLSVEQVAKIAGQIEDRYELMVWLGAMAGLRIGETLGLTLADVDFEKKRITVWRQLREGKHTATTKTGKRRTVPVSDDLLARIRRHVDAYGVSRLGTLLSTETGAPLTHRTVYRQEWPVAIKGMSLADDIDTPHALRHFFASMHIDQGTSPKALQEMLGHTKIATTMDTYVHLFERHDESLNQVFDGVFSTALRAVA